MLSPTSSRRAMCATCLRPQSTCICGLALSTPGEVDVLILQHPDEVNQAKGSARLLHLCLLNSHLPVGERFDPAELDGLLHANARTPLLLYPPTPGLPAPPPAPALPPAALRLVVLDATWRKSRKMLYLNPALQTLPRLPLEQAPPSAYRVRKAQRTGQLSTFEATIHALAQLEGKDARYAPLAAVFESFVRTLEIRRPPV